ncbi:MAG TPA: hypothetical protein VI790_06275 [Candidatus Nanoarchaeia archaeon]|nr:hypothetical protein [Candidatus Nanoarchaeia archaeon]
MARKKKKQESAFLKSIFKLIVIFSVIIFIISQVWALMNIRVSISSLIPTQVSLTSSTWRARVVIENPAMSGLIHINKITSNFYAGTTLVGESSLQDYYISKGENVLNLDYEISHLSGVYALLTGSTQLKLKTKVDLTFFWVIPYTILIEPTFTSSASQSTGTTTTSGTTSGTTSRTKTPSTPVQMTYGTVQKVAGTGGWTSNGATITQATQGTLVTITMNIKAVTNAKGNYTIWTKKDLAFLPDEYYYGKNFPLTMNAGDTQTLSFTFEMPAKEDYLRGIFVVTAWNGALDYEMPDGYPPRLGIK